MLSFLSFLSEALKPIPGVDKGFEALHDLGDGHQVYLKISHLSGGHHKVTALYKAPDKTPDKATVARSGRANVSTAKRIMAVNRVFADVKHFVDNNDWNSIVLGGSDAKNKALYRHVGDKMARQSGGAFTAHPIAGAGVRLVKTTPIANPVSSGVVDKPEHDELEGYRSRVKDRSGYGSSSRSSDRSSDRKSRSSDSSSRPGGFSDDMSGHKYAPSGWKKSKMKGKGDGEGSAALSVASVGSSASSAP